jgi:(p)ppGpp synthase/HD superfamily hydrolase
MCGMSRVSKRGLELLVFQDMRSHTCALTDTYHVVRTCMPACVQGYISRGGVRVHRTSCRKSLPEERILEDTIKEKSESHRWINGRIKGGWDEKGYVLQYIWNVLANNSGCFRQNALRELKGRIRDFVCRTGFIC